MGRERKIIKTLSTAETVVMKAIWDAGKDISFAELLELINTEYEKDYKRTTLATYLQRLEDKDFIEIYHKGKFAYIRVMTDEDDYKQQLIRENTRFWYNGNTMEYMTALFRSGELSAEDVKRLREIVDEMDT